MHCIEKAIFFIVVKSLFRNEKFILDEIVLGTLLSEEKPHTCIVLELTNRFARQFDQA